MGFIVLFIWLARRIENLVGRNGWYAPFHIVPCISVVFLSRYISVSNGSAKRALTDWHTLTDPQPLMHNIGVLDSSIWNEGFDPLGSNFYLICGTGEHTVCKTPIGVKVQVNLYNWFVLTRSDLKNNQTLITGVSLFLRQKSPRSLLAHWLDLYLPNQSTAVTWTYALNL